MPLENFNHGVEVFFNICSFCGQIAMGNKELDPQVGETFLWLVNLFGLLVSHSLLCWSLGARELPETSPVSQTSHCKPCGNTKYKASDCYTVRPHNVVAQITSYSFVPSYLCEIGLCQPDYQVTGND